ARYSHARVGRRDGSRNGRGNRGGEDRGTPEFRARSPVARGRGHARRAWRRTAFDRGAVQTTADLVKDPQHPGVSTSTEEALRIGCGNREARLLAPAFGARLHVLLQRPRRPFGGVILHLADDLFPGTDVR